MITTKDIYDKTSNGLDIILYFYPQAREVVDKKIHHSKSVTVMIRHPPLSKKSKVSGE